MNSTTEHIVELRQQIKKQQGELQRLCDEVAQETFWLKAGDVVLHKVKYRQGFWNRLKEFPVYSLVSRISSCGRMRCLPGQAEVNVWLIDNETGALTRGGFHIMYPNGLQRVGHIDDWETVERIDLKALLA